MAGQPLTITLPAIGAPGTLYASQINTAITTLETELERKVVPADMDVNTDLSFLSGTTSSAITDLKRAGLTLQDEAVISAAAAPMSLFAGGTDGELYFNDNSGRQIQITTGGTVNVSTTGGINGAGYGEDDVEVLWVSGDSRYELRLGPDADDLADLKLNDLYLADGSGNYVRVAAPSISADYVFTLPTAVPASTSVVLMDSSGTLSTTRAVSVDSVTTSGVITGGDGITATVNKHITVSGTGKFKHGSEKLILSGAAFIPGQPEVDNIGYVNGCPTILSGTTNVTLVAALQLPIGKRVTAVVFRAVHGTGASTRTYGFYSVNFAASRTTIASNTSVSSASNVSVTLAGVSETIAASNTFYFEVDLSETGDALIAVEVSYDCP